MVKNAQKNTTKKNKVSYKNKRSYAKLRRWVIPAVFGAALSALAFAPTFAETVEQSPTVSNMVTQQQQMPTTQSNAESIPANTPPNGNPLREIHRKVCRMHRKPKRIRVLSQVHP